MKFYTNLPKGLTLKVRKLMEVIPAIGELTVEKLAYVKNSVKKID